MPYRIANWDKHFENATSRRLKRLLWVAIPNKTDGEGYTALVDHPDGAAHLGAWYAIVEAASKHTNRGQLPNGLPQNLEGVCRSLARISRLPAGVFAEVIPRLIEIGWISKVQSNQQAETKGEEIDSGSRTGAADHGGFVALKGMEGNGREQKTPLCEKSVRTEEGAQSAFLEKSPYTSRWYEEQHDRFYRSYWRKVGRKDSFRAFERRVKKLAKTGLSHEEAVEFLIAKAGEDKARFETTDEWEWRQKLHPATWLNGERWQDEAPPPREEHNSK